LFIIAVSLDAANGILYAPLYGSLYIIRLDAYAL